METEQKKWSGYRIWGGLAILLMVGFAWVILSPNTADAAAPVTYTETWEADEVTALDWSRYRYSGFSYARYTPMPKHRLYRIIGAWTYGYRYRNYGGDAVGHAFVTRWRVRGTISN